ncbi:hypothetical protein NPIL_506871 [Nephila pilipes]|uniref:Uncharacterized protein n=1 Tax=Nephila pilipes TaxID=299642 RepID=A0A8X6Q786_NEPPI|nr:hypothetical protein NPIL_506871 [Nephila pilipes]
MDSFHLDVSREQWVRKEGRGVFPNMAVYCRCSTRGDVDSAVTRPNRVLLFLKYFAASESPQNHLRHFNGLHNIAFRSCLGKWDTFLSYFILRCSSLRSGTFQNRFPFRTDEREPEKLSLIHCALIVPNNDALSCAKRSSLTSGKKVRQLNFHKLSVLVALDDASSRTVEMNCPLTFAYLNGLSFE